MAGYRPRAVELAFPLPRSCPKSFLLGDLEGRALRRTTNEVVARLLWKDIVCRRAEDPIECSICQLCFGRVERRAVLAQG